MGGCSAQGRKCSLLSPSLSTLLPSTPPYPPPSPSISSTQVLRSILPIKDEDVVVGQYRGDTDDPTVPDGSKTPTYATVVLHINNERWDGERS